MSDETYIATGQAADRAVEALHRIDDKVAMLRRQRLEDPDSATDKLLKSALPTITGMIAGKLFQMAWDKVWLRHGPSSGKTRKGLMMNIAFAAASAAFGAAVSALSDRGSQALVDRRHRKSRR